ncbi:MAG: PEGA domain-containing protein [Deltaproteobacteria bacterium]|nr:PEGA domain-containing protein [Deltaproteobacteria bacterium]
MLIFARRFFFFLCLAGFGLLVPAQARAKAINKVTLKARVALLKLNAVGVDEAEIRTLKDQLKRVLGKVGAFIWLPESKVQARLKRSGQAGLGTVEQQIKALGVPYVITGTVGGLGDSMSLDLRVYDGIRGVELRRAAAEVPLKAKDRSLVLEELMVQLLRPERWVGALDLKISEAGARIMLDGLQVAVTPLDKPLGGLIPGKHILMVSKEGFRDLSQFIEIRYNRVFRLEVDLNNSTVLGQLYEKRRPKPKPKVVTPPPVVFEEAPDSKWQSITGWTCLGLGLASATAGGLLVWYANDIERQLSDSRPTTEDQEELESLYDEGQRANRWGNGLMLAGAAVSVVSAGFFLWSWLDGGSAAPEVKESTTTVGILPTQGGLSLGLSHRW